MDNLEEMDKVLGRHSLPKLNQEETENMNRSITNSETETMFMKKLPTNKSPGPDAFTGVYAALSCPTLWDPIDYSPPGSSAHNIFQARILEWVAISYSK